MAQVFARAASDRRIFCTVRPLPSPIFCTTPLSGPSPMLAFIYGDDGALDLPRSSYERVGEAAGRRPMMGIGVGRQGSVRLWPAAAGAHHWTPLASSAAEGSISTRPRDLRQGEVHSVVPKFVSIIVPMARLLYMVLFTEGIIRENSEKPHS
jgi:hypothetical protein